LTAPNEYGSRTVSGRIWAARSFSARSQTQKHRRHTEILEWLGKEFDPDAFDRVSVNKKLAALGRRSRRSKDRHASA
jgi:hypothetical protein